MSLTANFDYCVAARHSVPVKTIFHLALKNEEMFPHNVGPFARNFSGRQLTVDGRVSSTTRPIPPTWSSPTTSTSASCCRSS